jgi:hypothetical protein
MVESGSDRQPHDQAIPSAMELHTYVLRRNGAGWLDVESCAAAELRDILPTSHALPINWTLMVC